ncbi:conserved unknown protein [Ectocarpus siliculosus]|uniref:EF-hand domain-containing protein n=1 Tax=Ectocarpus siliculosus TaxID=2880 RepID=D7FLZ1_ECTSI|nr:conserved unknown protein [Ectocarpus siliculosus]|eukprot:CBJ29816.1 conserved unknown protein [Ectocarpus siliculosus]
MAEACARSRVQVEEHPVYDLPKEWKTLVSTLCLRTNFEPAELADLFQRFRQLAGTKEYLTAGEFRRTVRRNFGIMNEEWVKKYFKAFDRNHSGTIDFQEYVMGFAGMARVLTDKKAHSLIGLSTGSNIVRSGRSARLFWDGPPRRVAVIKKWKDPVVAAKTEKLVHWLQSQGLTVLVDPTEDNELGDDGEAIGPVFMPEVGRFDPGHLATQTDFIICLGGDGTVLKAAQYFDDSTPIPPTLAFGLGSLGFLAPFNPSQCQSMIKRVLDAFRRPISVTLRTRLRGEVYSREGQLERVFYSLNEFIVNRGISGVLSTLEVFVDGELVTTAQGDGLIVASPSGSTAYNISVGGCMVSPLVPATLITPIAPHSLSFRPILTSASSEITVRIPDTARADGWMCHDATEAVVMKKGTFVKLSTASIPLPTVNQRELDGDWFQSIRDKLNWNLRTLQTPYHEHQSSDLVEDQSTHRSSSSAAANPPPTRFFTLPTSRAKDESGSSKGDSPPSSPI